MFWGKKNLSFKFFFRPTNTYGIRGYCVFAEGPNIICTLTCQTTVRAKETSFIFLLLCDNHVSLSFLSFTILKFKIKKSDY